MPKHLAGIVNSSLGLLASLSIHDIRASLCDSDLPMFDRIGDFVSRFWWLIILGWIALLAIAKSQAPAWDDVTYDGDLAYMPADMTSVVGEHLLEEAFPDGRSKSEMVVIVSRNDGNPMDTVDAAIVDRIAARLKNLYGVAEYQKAERLWPEAAELRKQNESDAADEMSERAHAAQTKAVEAWKEAIDFDSECGLAWNNLALHYKSQGNTDEFKKHSVLATDFTKGLKNPGHSLLPVIQIELPIIEIWTYRHPIFGKKLGSKDGQAQLLVVRLSQEFMATENVEVLDAVNSIINEVKSGSDYPSQLEIGLTGSASVGSDMLKSAGESIAHTERYTICAVILILLFVYRSPLMLAIPLITIVVSQEIATSLVAALTTLHLLPGFDWWNFKIFTTTKIFVVVILFGAGTDYCLFLISRFREELDGNPQAGNQKAVAVAVSGVADALVGSAFTTIVGLAMMFFADFGKFRNSGPAIGLCLAVTLFACLSLAPALLVGMGKAVFWPFGHKATGGPSRAVDQSNFMTRTWEAISEVIVAYPGRVLVCCALAMVPFAYLGSSVEVTYNFLSELSPDRSSKIGTRAMRKHFPVGETGPLIVLARTQGRDLDSDDGKAALLALTKKLYVDGVESVRSFSAPNGDKPEGYGLRVAAMQAHAVTRSLYLSQLPSLGGDVARLELVLQHEPFSRESIDVLNKVEQLLADEGQRRGSFWYGTEFVFSGTTAAIRDLKTVTRSDNVRIQILVVLGVLAVLVLILRRPIVCVYLILTVLFSYYATLGATEMFFKYAYGNTFEGLDWKVPLFLFVILVAIGQDYNIYLATRVFEEQEQHGLFAGLRRAIVRTGGIITSCGVIMAGTFISMVSGSLRGIVELGFALSLGVMLDTFVVRPILVPAFLALLFRASAARSDVGRWFNQREELASHGAE